MKISFAIRESKNQTSISRGQLNNCAISKKQLGHGHGSNKSQSHCFFYCKQKAKKTSYDCDLYSN